MIKLISGASRAGKKVAGSLPARAAASPFRLAGATARGTAKTALNPHLALLGVGGFAMGIGSTDPVKAGIAKFEESMMGDPNFSRSILGTQMGPGALFGVSGARMGYINRTSINNSIMYGNTSRNMQEVGPPGSMVFGMFNSRM